MKILHVTSSLNPALGGLSACIRSLVPALAALGHPSEIASLDAPAETFLRDLPCPVHAFGPGRLGYAYAPRLPVWLQDELARFDVVIVHGLWQYHGWATYRALRRPGAPPYFVFSHGMLDPWFRRQFPLKHLKKYCYWWLAERRILRGAAAVLFTCEEEKRLARQSFAGSSYREAVVRLGIAAPPDHPAAHGTAWFAAHPALAGRPFWLFLGRIHPKKGVEMLLAAYAALAAETAVPPLVIAGPCISADYLRELQALAVATCPPGAVSWPGMVDGDAKWAVLRAAEVFILPSHQENFGIAVVEALACGCPVLISDQVNIWREIAADGTGLVEPDTTDGTRRLLDRWRALAAEPRRQLCAAATGSFRQQYEIGIVAHRLVAVLQQAVAGTHRA